MFSVSLVLGSRQLRHHTHCRAGMRSSFVSSAAAGASLCFGLVVFRWLRAKIWPELSLPRRRLRAVAGIAADATANTASDGAACAATRQGVEEREHQNPQIQTLRIIPLNRLPLDVMPIDTCYPGLSLVHLEPPVIMIDCLPPRKCDEIIRRAR